MRVCAGACQWGCPHCARWLTLATVALRPLARRTAPQGRERRPEVDVRRVVGARVRASGRAGLSRWDLATGALLLVVVAALAVARPLSPRPAAAAQPSLSPSAQLSQGSAAMAGAIAKGFDFTVISRSTLYARDGGPKIQVPDPSDPSQVAGLADSYYLGASAAGPLRVRRPAPARIGGPPAVHDQHRARLLVHGAHRLVGVLLRMKMSTPGCASPGE